MALRASIVGGDQLHRVAKALRQAGRTDLQREVAKAVKKQAAPTLKDLRQAARTVQVRGKRAGGKKPFTHVVTPKHLRERMAAATEVEYRANEREARLSFHVNPGRMGGAKVIPRYIDLGKPWRHPIMGHRGRWAASEGKSWFFPPIKKDLPDIRRGISDALDEITRSIEETP